MQLISIYLAISSEIFCVYMENWNYSPVLSFLWFVNSKGNIVEPYNYSNEKNLLEVIQSNLLLKVEFTLSSEPPSKLDQL